MKLPNTKRPQRWNAAYFGASVLILEVGIVFSWGVFRAYWSSLVFVGARVLILDIRIVFSWGFQNTCSQATCFHRLRWFLSEHVFSYWTLVSFLAGIFSEHLFPGYKFVSCSLILSKQMLLYWKLAVPVF